METKKPTRRVLALADFACATGFAQVSQNIVAQLLKDPDIDYMIDVVSINYHGLPNEWLNIHPRVRLFPALYISNGDPFGRKGYLELLSTGVYDITWILQDTFNVEPMSGDIKKIRTDLMAAGKKVFKFIFYYPIDATPKENMITKAVSIADIPVVYTKYGYEESIKHDPTLSNRLKVVPHGIDVNVFKPVDAKQVAEFRHEYFVGNTDDKFVVMNVNRNQPRKDIARTMQVFKYFKQQAPEAVLYLHMDAGDVAYDLNEIARLYELIPDKDYIVPKYFDRNNGVSVELLNMIYNSVDCVMSTSLGEGWGLSLTESMATKTPIVAPDHTSCHEILEDGRGLLVKAGSTISEWIVESGDNERMRPLTNVPDMVDKLMWVRNHKGTDELNEMVEKAYKHLHDNWTWDIVGAQWREIFKNSLTEVKAVQVGRNDPCYCGSGKKFKHCHGGQ